MLLSSTAVCFLWAALSYAVLGLAFLIIQTLRSPKSEPKISECRAWLECLLKNGYVGENLLFRDKNKNRFIRFEKYTDSNGNAGLALTFPKIGWGKELLLNLKNYSESRCLKFSTLEENEPYARVETGGNTDEAFTLCQMIWTELYRFDEKAAIFLKVGDLSSVHELMGRTVQIDGYGVEVQKRTVRYMKARMKHVGLPWLAPTSFLGVVGFACLIVLSGVVFVASLVGLPFSTLMTLDDPPSWQLELGPVSLEGSAASLIFFVAYLLTLEIFRRCMRYSTINWQQRSRIETFLHAPKRPIAIAIPIAVVLIWSGS